MSKNSRNFETLYLRPRRLMVRSPASHAGNTGSNPVGVTNEKARFI